MSNPELNAIGLSLQVAGAAVAWTLPLAVLVGHQLARRRCFARPVIESLVNLPLVLPPVVTGYLLLAVLGRQSAIGRWSDAWFGMNFVFDWKGAAIAGGIVAFPLMVRSIRSAFAAIDDVHRDAAATLGAGPWDCFWHVDLPLARHGMIAGAVMGFARALGEFGATIMVAGNIPGRTQTIPLFIYEQVQTPGGIATAVPVIVVAVAVAVIAIVVSGRLERRSQGRTR